MQINGSKTTRLHPFNDPKLDRGRTGPLGPPRLQTPVFIQTSSGRPGRSIATFRGRISRNSEIIPQESVLIRVIRGLRMPPWTLHLRTGRSPPPLRASRLCVFALNQRLASRRVTKANSCAVFRLPSRPPFASLDLSFSQPPHEQHHDQFHHRPRNHRFPR